MAALRMYVLSLGEYSDFGEHDTSEADCFSLNGHSEARHHGCFDIVLSLGGYSDFGEHYCAEADHFSLDGFSAAGHHACSEIVLFWSGHSGYSRADHFSLVAG